MSIRHIANTAFLIFLFAFACANGRANAQTPAPTFTIGVLPNVSARVILNNYQPMREYFARELKRDVDIATAADFIAYHQASQRGDYPMLITAANLGRVAQLDANLTPIAIYEPAIPGLLVAAAGNANDTLDQLRGKSLALANPQSLVALRGLQWLKQQGLNVGTDFKIVRASNDDSLGTLIRTGEAPLAMMSMGEFRAIGEDTRKNLRVVKEFAKVPGFLVMTHPNLSSADRQQIKSLILQFPKSEEGKKFSALANVANIREVTAADLDPLDAFVAETRAGLSGISGTK